MSRAEGTFGAAYSRGKIVVVPFAHDVETDIVLDQACPAGTYFQHNRVQVAVCTLRKGLPPAWTGADDRSAHLLS